MNTEQLKTACTIALCMIGDNNIAASHRYKFIDVGEVDALFNLVSFARQEIEKMEAITGETS